MAGRMRNRGHYLCTNQRLDPGDGQYGVLISGSLWYVWWYQSPACSDLVELPITKTAALHFEPPNKTPAQPVCVLQSTHSYVISR